MITAQHITDYCNSIDTVNTRTVKEYQNEIARYVDFCNANGLQVATKGGFVAYKRHMHSSGCSVSTINTRTTIVKGFAAWCSASGICSNFMSEIRCEKVATFAKIAAVKKADVNRALNGNLDEQTRTIILLGVYCGLRSCEISALNYNDLVKTESGYSLAIRGKGYNGSVSRWQPVPKRAVKDIAKAFGGRLSSNDSRPLLTSDSHKNSGERMSVLTIQRRVKQAFAAVGVECSSHQLRHAYALYCFEKCDNVEVVKELLGHKQASTTLRYIHEGTDSEKVKIVNKIRF